MARNRLLMALLLVGVLCLVCAWPASAQDATGGVVHQYRDAAGAWSDTIQSIAERLFALLAGIEIALTGILLFMRERSLAGFLGELQIKLILLAFLFAILSTWSMWFPFIASGFMSAGQQAVGTNVSPGNVVGMGIDLMWQVLDKWQFTIFSAMGNNLVAFLCALVILLSFFIIGAQLVVALVEVALVTVGGLLLMGFAAFRGTAGLADGYVSYLFYIGIKIFLLYLLVGLGEALARDWSQMIATANLQNMRPLLQATAGAFVFGILVYVVPEKVSTRVTQTMDIGIAQGLSAAS